MKKQKWTEKPITWGGYAALCAVSFIISMVMSVYYYIAWFEPDWWGRLKESVGSWFKKITHKE